MHFDDKETATVLAALRLLQEQGCPDHLLDIATDGDRWHPAGGGEIDILCEKIDTTEPVLDRYYSIASVAVVNLRATIDQEIEDAEEEEDRTAAAALRLITDDILDRAAGDVAQKVSLDIAHVEDWMISVAKRYAREGDGPAKPAEVKTLAVAAPARSAMDMIATTAAKIEGLLQTMQGGSQQRGRWFAPDGAALDMSDGFAEGNEDGEVDAEGNTWSFYDDEEQQAWLSTVAGSCREGLEVCRLLKTQIAEAGR